ncbi:MAG: DUF1592 domain-containing protein [Planctomycetaceae bacterium]|nr:DUF1592 domain-containing protein [Planctomycetaceae bacterium]
MSLLLTVGSGVVAAFTAGQAAAQDVSVEQLAHRFAAGPRDVLKRYCLECHATRDPQGELDLERFTSIQLMQQDVRPWQRVVEMLNNGEMPPEDSAQPTDEERQLLSGWVRQFLDAEARRNAGDPGPVVLRRLNNTEFTYTIQDLTGVPLNPAAEFPVDSAAGEGFTNVGASLVISPAMVQKYLDASRDIASHAVLLPDGFRFSVRNTRRDWVNETVDQIRDIYGRYTSGGTDTSILNRWSVSDPRRSTEQDGRIDISRYFAALLHYRQQIVADPGQIAVVAREENLSPRYLGLLADALLLPQDGESSLLLADLRDRMQQARPDDAAAIAGDVAAWQNVLWKFNSVGHFGSIRPWQEAVTPLPDSLQLVQPLPAGNQPVQVTLNTIAAGSNADGNVVIWSRPRLEAEGRLPILLKDVRAITQVIREQQQKQLPLTKQHLGAVVDLMSGSDNADSHANAGLDGELTRRWASFVGLSRETDLAITSHMPNRLTNVSGYAAISGWGVDNSASLLTNTSNDPVTFLTLTVPARGVTVHPWPQLDAIVSWKSPVSGSITIRGFVADADDKCGNGAAWRLELKRRTGVAVLASGVFDSGGRAEFQTADTHPVAPGDVVSLIVNARDANHGCDTTHVQFTISETGGEQRQWNLSEQIVDRVGEGNPLADTFGNTAVWHIHTAAADGSSGNSDLPAGSILAAWKAAVLTQAEPESVRTLAEQFTATLTASGESLSPADQQVVALVRSWYGPLDWTGQALEKLRQADAAAQTTEGDPTIGLPVNAFGRLPGGDPGDGGSLYTATPSRITATIPPELAAGSRFVVEGSLDAKHGTDGRVQLQLLTGGGGADRLVAGTAILTRPDSRGRRELEQAYADFRSLFPAAMCHARIVPVDEVVTLVLFHREDHELARLMLNEDDAARLDRLWSELRFISQDALISETAFEQLMEFATQDADPTIFEPLRQPIRETADRYRAQLVACEPRQLEQLIGFAQQAWRRPLAKEEAEKLRSLYQRLRENDLNHEESFRLLMARILTAPAFLYRVEDGTDGADAVPADSPRIVSVSPFEQASRLSYFLWSSLPDEPLLKAAETGEFSDAELRQQLARMLADGKMRRMAVEFGCQWLHIRDFDQLDEKNEALYPEFKQLRGDMYEESIRFFDDLLRHNGSVLDILNADYTFVNPRLAQAYGIPGEAGVDSDAEGWRRVSHSGQYGRGGILRQASVLAKQSGASRTSPILRGNWVSETLLGERLPRPPKNVPQLPDNLPEGLTERQLIERHSSDAACVKCHLRIDPYGFALENYDTIGRFRSVSADGRPIDTATELPDGTQLQGVDGLRRYLSEARRDDFLRHFCHKLLGYALGRSVQLSDEPLIDQMMQQLRENEYRIHPAIEAIVLSPQFRSVRVGGVAE